MSYQPTRAVNLPLEDFFDLEFHFDGQPPRRESRGVRGTLVKRWLAAETERLALQKNGRALRGFQWKNLFLPNGTSLRTNYANTIEFARVAGDCIVADDGAKLSPSSFANRHDKGRNAWRMVWLRFPGNEFWVRADDCRRRFDGGPRKRSKRGSETS
ncbi:hypothetical protein IP91_02195 [Pseudoduganella lurida]|uniref:Uncharacterized protein n=1 Tax=Pseudoduganella lurida TaxID=1036180 RepID=A0A562RBD4_9BURK|nr:hypothetical protein [Pseudoduganella lurida]TWI66382.1 hypothetical protein IP91_02195 [Pseudoduganella lurida]